MSHPHLLFKIMLVEMKVMHKKSKCSDFALVEEMEPFLLSHDRPIKA